MKDLFLILATILSFNYSFSQSSYKDSLQAYIDDYVKNHEVVTGDNKKYMQFFPADETYRVIAKFEKAANPIWFKIATSGKEEKLYRVYGTVTFKINDSTLKLNLYQSRSLLQDPKYKDYIILLFSDATTGKETYEAGRYIDFTIGDIKNNTLVIDFNKAYNPYCAYEKGKYNCPIPPIENRLAVAIMAGEKIYNKPVK
jgi:uncharacterized protein (DUF1684 family)